MDVSQAIYDRRSIRRFEERPVSREMIESLLEAAIKAPSGKNGQPWRFVVLQGQVKDRLVDVMENRVAAVKASGFPVGSAENSARIMRQAPVLILVYDAGWVPEMEKVPMGWVRAAVDIQSIGAAIQNLLLAATAAGLGSLWICDVFFAKEAIEELAGAEGGLIAAVSIGYPAEAPAARSRKPLQEVAKFMEELP